MFPRVAVALLATVTLLAGCGSSGIDATAASGKSSASVSASAPSTGADDADWPPDLPAGVPTTGEHAWRATWAPDPDAEQQFLTGLREDNSLEVFTDEELIGAGYAVCGFYYEGAEGGAPVDAMVAAGKYDVLQATSIDLAARHYFCMNIDPYGGSY